jgi:hypothetical protein
LRSQENVVSSNVWTPKGGIWKENACPLSLHPSYLVDFGGKGKYRGFKQYKPVSLRYR